MRATRPAGADGCAPGPRPGAARPSGASQRVRARICSTLCSATLRGGAEHRGGPTVRPMDDSTLHTTLHNAPRSRGGPVRRAPACRAAQESRRRVERAGPLRAQGAATGGVAQARGEAAEAAKPPGSLGSGGGGHPPRARHASFCGGPAPPTHPPHRAPRPARPVSARPCSASRVLCPAFCVLRSAFCALPSARAWLRCARRVGVSARGAHRHALLAG